MVYTITLSPALDYILNCKEVTKGVNNKCEDASLLVGGNGLNVCMVLTELGVENTALGFVAGFVGDEIIRAVEERGVKQDFIRLKSGNSRINVNIRTDKETMINMPGPDVTQAELNDLLKKLDNIKSGDYLVMGGRVPKTLPDNIYEIICKRLSGRGVNLVVDCDKSSLVSTLKYNPFLIKPNRQEIEEICDVKINSIDDVVVCANVLKSFGAKNVIVSLAKDGSVLVDENSNIDVLPAIQGSIKNSIGAGDSMIAGFLASYIQTGDYKKAHRMGSVCGAATAFSMHIAKKDDILSLL